MENEDIRNFLGLTDIQGGVLVGKIPPMSSSKDLVKVGDVLLEIDGIPIAYDGTVEFPSDWTVGQELGSLEDLKITTYSSPTRINSANETSQNFSDSEWVDESSSKKFKIATDIFERIDLGFLISQKFVGEKCRFKLLRSDNPFADETEKLIKTDPTRGQRERTIPQSLNKNTNPYEVNVEVVLTEKNLLVQREGSRIKGTKAVRKGKKSIDLNANHLKLPSYFIIYGFCFTVLTDLYLISEYGESFDTDAPIELLYAWSATEKKFSNEQIIILSVVLAHDFNSGYEVLIYF